MQKANSYYDCNTRATAAAYYSTAVTCASKMFTAMSTDLYYNINYSCKLLLVSAENVSAVDYKF